MYGYYNVSYDCATEAARDRLHGQSAQTRNTTACTPRQSEDKTTYIQLLFLPKHFRSKALAHLAVLLLTLLIVLSLGLQITLRSWDWTVLWNLASHYSLNSSVSHFTHKCNKGTTTQSSNISRCQRFKHAYVCVQCDLKIAYCPCLVSKLVNTLTFKILIAWCMQQRRLLEKLVLC